MPESKVNSDAITSRDGPSFDLFEPKLRPPALRSGVVARTALVDRLLAASGTPVMSVVAPPGAGKTTLLAQWAERRDRVAWVSVDDRDNDPAVFLTYAAAALNGIEAIDPEVFRTLDFPGLSIASEAVPRLAQALASMQRPAALVFDHVELLQNRQSLDALAELTTRVPSGSQIVVASRHEPPLPMPLLRSRGDVVEVGVDDLAMDIAEARALLDGAGVVLDDEGVADLVRRTEGWPVGLYLAARSLLDGRTDPDMAMSFAGNDRLMAEYMRSVLLDRLPRRTVAFLTRTSVLERLSGPLCDEVLGIQGSAEVLDSLDHSQLLLVALDRRREWYRYHNLFRDLLRAELKRREPDLVPVLHERARSWCEANGMREQAIVHAQAAGDADAVARLASALAVPVYLSGRVETVLTWFDWFETAHLGDAYPEVAVHAAIVNGLIGRPAAAERWVTAAERAPSRAEAPDGSSMESWLALMRAVATRDGVAAMRRDAELARRDLAAGSVWRTTALLAEGRALVLEGDVDLAERAFVRAYDAGIDGGGLTSAALAQAERARLAAERDDWAQAAVLVAEALRCVEAANVRGYLSVALTYSVAARVALHERDIPRAHELLALAAEFQPLQTYAVPSVSVQILLEMTQAYIELADMDAAGVALRQAVEILQVRPDLGGLGSQAAQLQATLDTFRAASAGTSALTAAELRLLPLLSTHLTFPEIGERLFISRHTVKTQATSIYQKLGVSSRGDAVDRAREVGLLPQ